MSLQLTAVHAYYGESHVLQGVDLTVPAGSCVALLGRNGAGKTTTLRAVMGLTPARAGTVRFEGDDITREPTYRVARRGIGFVPAGRRVFGDLTVAQNLRLGAAGDVRGGAQWTLEQVHALFPKLYELAHRRARVLSGGEQQMLKLGRCLLGQPRMLLLDEPSEGLAPTIVRQVAQALRRLRDAGFSMLLCEQNARFALELADEAYVMEKGLIRFRGSAAELAGSAELAQHLGF